MDFFMPPYVIAVMLKSFHYPIKDIIGVFNCHVMHVAEVLVMIVAQCHTFFVTLFRYICIFHEVKIMKLKMTAGVSYIYDTGNATFNPDAAFNFRSSEDLFAFCHSSCPLF